MYLACSFHSQINSQSDITAKIMDAHGEWNIKIQESTMYLSLSYFSSTYAFFFFAGLAHMHFRSNMQQHNVLTVSETER